MLGKVWDARIPPKRIMGGYSGAIRDVSKIQMYGKVGVPRIPPKRIMGVDPGAI